MLVVATVLMIGVPAATYAQNAEKIVEIADRKRLGNTSYSRMTLTVIRPQWQREISMKVWTRNNEFLLILITGPARDKGISFLKRGNEFWNWIPRIDRNIKLPPSAMVQPWMGSDFSNDDLVKMSSIVKDYDHKILNEEKVGNRAAYKIEMIPKEEAAVVWGKVVTWIDRKDYLFLKTEYYDEDGKLINTVMGEDIRLMGGREVTSRLEIRPADDPDKRTVLIYEELEYNIPVAEDFFSLQNMKRVR